jgi:DNA replicative helicase MCM subunit Mcm2 (Cdc46/Mcm family)
VKLYRKLTLVTAFLGLVVPLLGVFGHGILFGVEQNNGKGKLYAVMYAESIEYEQRQELEVTDKDILSLKRFAKMPNVIERLVSMVAPDVMSFTYSNMQHQNSKKKWKDYY